MKIFLNIREKRKATFLVLLVWLFALASGVANACLLEARETHLHIAAAEYFEVAHVPTLLRSHSNAVADHDDGSHAAKAPCLKVCDDGSHSMPKPDLKVAQADPGPAYLVAVLWTPALPVIVAPGQVDDRQPAIPALPIRVRYSRLAL